MQSDSEVELCLRMYENYYANAEILTIDIYNATTFVMVQNFQATISFEFLGYGILNSLILISANTLRDRQSICFMYYKTWALA
jgi:hypothetical protein